MKVQTTQNKKFAGRVHCAVNTDRPELGTEQFGSDFNNS